MIKLVATDIDGTILGESRQFTEGVLSCVNTLKTSGIKLVLVTGRMFAGAKKIAEKLNLNTPVVAYQGGLIKTLSGEILYERVLDKNIVTEIIDWARKNNVQLNLYSDDVLYSEKDNEAIKRYTTCQGIDYQIKNFDEIPFNHINKLLAIDYTNVDLVSEWVTDMSLKYPNLHIVKSTPYFCEFSSLDATKACAVKFLQDYWKIDKSETLAIGDQDNDIELLKSGGVAVAMANGTDNLKKYANYITDSVDNDGFVKAMEKFVLKGEQNVTL